MSEVAAPGAAPAPAGGDGGAQAPAPAPAAPQTPAPEAQAPEAPQTPAPADPNQPAAPAAPEQLTPEEQAAKAEDDEWAAAEKQIFPGLKSRNRAPQEANKNEQTQPEKAGEDGKTPQANPTDKEQNAEQKPGDDATKQDGTLGSDGNKPEDGAAPQNATASARATARQIAEQRQAVATDVRAKMFPNLPSTLQDADGDPINGPEDVMKLIDPRTGEAFTEEAAYAWFLQANAKFKEQLGQIDQRIEQIADLHLDIKDQADAVNSKYGEWLKANPKKRDEIWADFYASLVRDPESGLIIGMPMPLEKYYERVVGPLVAQSQQQSQADAAAKAQADAAAAAKAKAEAEKQKQQNRADRSDIYQPPANPNEDPETAEWAAAEKAVFGNQLPKK